MDLEKRLADYVERRREGLVRLLRRLVRIPSENTPPRGAELRCQLYIARFLRRLGWDVTVYPLSEVAGLESHPLYWPGRDYTRRPNVGARLAGAGAGRSLLLSGHVDTVPRGSLPWVHAPFGAEIEGNRLYGRGANDMKAGLAMNLFVAQALAALRIRLRGDLFIESVVDEEFGGVNGTLAGRLAGFNAEAAIITEPTALRVCPAQRGGRTAHIRLRAPGGILREEGGPAGVIEALRCLLIRAEEFARRRRQAAAVHEYYRHTADPVPVAVTKIAAGGWGSREPIGPPEQCDLEMYWQAMPGETRAQVDAQFFHWLEETVRAEPELFPQAPQVTFPIRWLPGSALPASEPLVREMAEAAQRALGRAPDITGIEGPCDMYVFHQGFATPALLWGPRGGNTHATDEYVELGSLFDAAKALLLFVCRWCGVA